MELQELPQVILRILEDLATQVDPKDLQKCIQILRILHILELEFPKEAMAIPVDPKGLQELLEVLLILRILEFPQEALATPVVPKALQKILELLLILLILEDPQQLATRVEGRELKEHRPPSILEQNKKVYRLFSSFSPRFLSTIKKFCAFFLVHKILLRWSDCIL